MPKSRDRQKILDHYPPGTASKVVSFGFRATPAESELIGQLARSHGLSAGEFCRMSALQIPLPAAVEPPLQAIEKEAVLELKKIGTNFNQTVAALNRANLTNEVASPEVIHECELAARAVRRAVFKLIGMTAVKEERDKDLQLVSSWVVEQPVLDQKILNPNDDPSNTAPSVPRRVKL